LENVEIKEKLGCGGYRPIHPPIYSCTAVWRVCTKKDLCSWNFNILQLPWFEEYWLSCFGQSFLKSTTASK
jgi:hypothetical protein